MLTLQLRHAPWEGIRIWDMVMPLFLFMAGASMPFALSPYLYSRRAPRREAYIKVSERLLVLYILGMIVQGNLLGLDLTHLYLYSNTLQAIAVGYAISALLLLHCPIRWQIITTASLLVIYALPMILTGDITPEGNFAELVDRAVLGRFRDGVYWDDLEGWHFASDYHYTWVWSSLTFVATVMLGALAGHIMRSREVSRERIALRLAGIGLALMLLGLLWSLWLPIVKCLWTSSMALIYGRVVFRTASPHLLYSGLQGM